CVARPGRLRVRRRPGVRPPRRPRRPPRHGTHTDAGGGSGPVTAARPEGLRHLAGGKVRDLYEVDADHLLLVASDRISAFDVVLDDPIPGKGMVLTALTQFWLGQVADLVPNHLVGWRAPGGAG